MDPSQATSPPERECKRDCPDGISQFFGSTRQKESKGKSLDYIRHTYGVSDSVAAEEAQQLVDQCRSRHWYLKEQLALHGDSIRLKWKQLSRQKREAMMLEARPSLYRPKWPEARVLNKLLESQGPRSTMTDDEAGWLDSQSI